MDGILPWKPITSHMPVAHCVDFEQSDTAAKQLDNGQKLVCALLPVQGMAAQDGKKPSLNAQHWICEMLGIAFTLLVTLLVFLGSL